MLKILGLFYNNNRDIKKGKRSKQSIDLQSFPNLENAVPIPTPTTLKTGNP